MEIWVVGYPAIQSGADTELDHNIDLWRNHDVDVHLVPLGNEDPYMRTLCDLRGCHTHRFSNDLFKDKIVASFCSGPFLNQLPEIIKAGRPKQVIWFNSMTWPFDLEVKAMEQGWIDTVGFVSRYQEKMLMDAWAKRGVAVPPKLYGYRPHFNPCHHVGWEMTEKPTDYFGIGRISRDDPSKYSADMWAIFRAVKAPKPIKVFLLGYGYEARKKLGNPPKDMDVTAWYPGQVSPRDFYKRVHCVLHKTGGSRESYCRIVPECFATGTIIAAENDFAFPELIENLETGWLCSTSKQLSDAGTWSAIGGDFRKEMAAKARIHLDAIAGDSICWPAWEKVFSK